MAEINEPQIETAFVTGATGLLGNNLVRLLVSRGLHVKALVRSREKAGQQFAGLPVEIVEGNMNNVARFVAQLKGADVLFHTAAFFRDSFKGGRHWKELYETNVRGTVQLLQHAYDNGLRRFVHTSSVAVLRGERGKLTDETMRRTATHADDYYLSKILCDREIDNFLEKHPDMWACMVLPGWMAGPGDIGPTSSGQVILDFINRKLPGVPPATFSLVDARDVAEALRVSAVKGRRGERYLAAGRHMPMAELFRQLERVTGISAPHTSMPVPVLLGLAALQELWARLSGRPALLSLATARLMISERDRSHFDNSKTERELGLRFRPAEETLRDTINWYAEHGWLQKDPVLPDSRVEAGARSC